jgi:hypothetical protein
VSHAVPSQVGSHLRPALMPASLANTANIPIRTYLSARQLDHAEPVVRYPTCLQPISCAQPSAPSLGITLLGSRPFRIAKADEPNPISAGANLATSRDMQCGPVFHNVGTARCIHAKGDGDRIIP